MAQVRKMIQPIRVLKGEAKLQNLLIITYILIVPRNPLPRDLLEETMRTLDLLFPFTGDEETRVYLKSEGQTFNQIRTPEGLGLSPELSTFPSLSTGETGLKTSTTCSPLRRGQIHSCGGIGGTERTSWRLFSRSWLCPSL
jgi:hypothetical protein